mgnify:CR=1 FL=1
MSTSGSILVGLATYNELLNLPSLVEAIHAELPEAGVLVVDDNSPDGTGRWCQEFSTGHSWLEVISRPEKMGLGTALALLMQSAIERGVTHLVTLDADWSHPPARLQAMLLQAVDSDVVIGSRYCPGGQISGWPWQRRFTSRCINTLSRLIMGLPIRDCSGNFRIYRTAILEKVRWENLNSPGYAFIEEILWELKLAGARFAEVPILFTDRKAGDSKLSFSEIAGAGRMIAGLVKKRLSSFSHSPNPNALG